MYIKLKSILNDISYTLLFYRTLRVMEKQGITLIKNKIKMRFIEFLNLNTNQQFFLEKKINFF